MPPRFNKEPINLIHRIPSQKQIDEARPVPPAYGQVLLQAGAICLSKVRNFFSNVVQYVGETSARVRRKPLALPDWTKERFETIERVGRQGAGHTQVAATSMAPNVTILQTPTPVQSGEVADLRACLVGQQDEIARLTSHIQELTSLVSAQRRSQSSRAGSPESNPARSWSATSFSGAPMRAEDRLMSPTAL